ncbi:MAG: hypothetical protein Q7R70_06565 [Candidatus Diapherotrites archaeon]|nr:hypothetical protein [Candidatus Diapherotrites archaeon]
MVDSSVVLGTVKNMIESGLNDDIIKETLKDIGLSDPEIQDVLRQAHGPNVEQPAPKRPQTPKKPIEENPTEPNPVERPGPIVFPEHDNALDNASVHNAISELGSKVDDLKERVDSINTSAPLGNSGNFEGAAGLQSRIDTISTDIKELKAGTNALVDLMKKILETDRDVLLRLEGKKK